MHKRDLDRINRIIRKCRKSGWEPTRRYIKDKPIHSCSRAMVNAFAALMHSRSHPHSTFVYAMAKEIALAGPKGRLP